MLRTPFYERQHALCESMRWTRWSGYYAVRSYLVDPSAEYWAIRTAAGLIDVTPLAKYLVSGPDSACFLSRVLVREVSDLPVGRVRYVCWCDDAGHVVGDGTVMRMEADRFLFTSTDPSFAWLSRHTGGHIVKILDVTDAWCALALQGPESRAILQELGVRHITTLPYFGAVWTELGGVEVWVSRTGYTGDLGYEIFIPAANGLNVWDQLVQAGSRYALRPVGLSALDICRIEAGLLLQHVDYHNALHALIPGRKSTPFELSMGWMVNLNRAPFIGQQALARKCNPRWKFLGLEVSWSETCARYEAVGLPPALPAEASRTSVPLYRDGARHHQIGYATSSTWSPLLKKRIALASVKTPFARGTIQFEDTVEHERHSISARVVSPRFYNPPHKVTTEA